MTPVAEEYGVLVRQSVTSASLKSASSIDRKEVLIGAAAHQSGILKAGAPDSLPSSMSEGSFESPGSPTTPLPPATGIWGVLRAWVYDSPEPQSTPVKAAAMVTETSQDMKLNSDLSAFEQRVQAMAATRCQTSSSGSDNSSNGICCSARGAKGHRPGRGRAMLQGLRSATASMSSEDSAIGSSSPEELYGAWQPQYEAAAHFLQTCLNTSVQGGPLREAVADAYGALHAVVALRQMALEEDRIEDVVSGAFFRPNQRLLLWMGGMRPTDMLACARIKMSALGEGIPEDVLKEVEKLQTACRNRQTALTKGFEELSEKLARATAVAQFVVASRHMGLPAGRKPAHKDCGVHSSMIQGIRRAMANMLIQADELRARLLEQLALMLTPRQLALVLMAPLNMLAIPS